MCPHCLSSSPGTSPPFTTAQSSAAPRPPPVTLPFFPPHLPPALPVTPEEAGLLESTPRTQTAVARHTDHYEEVNTQPPQTTGSTPPTAASPAPPRLPAAPHRSTGPPSSARWTRPLNRRIAASGPALQRRCHRRSVAGCELSEFGQSLPAMPRDAWRWAAYVRSAGEGR